MRRSALSVIVLCVALLLQGVAIAHAHGGAHSGGPICVTQDSVKKLETSKGHAEDGAQKKRSLPRSACAICADGPALGALRGPSAIYTIAEFTTRPISISPSEPFRQARIDLNAPPRAPPAFLSL
jgi:hypothetical protein